MRIGRGSLGGNSTKVDRKLLFRAIHQVGPLDEKDTLAQAPNVKRRQKAVISGYPESISPSIKVDLR